MNVFQQIHYESFRYFEAINFLDLLHPGGPWVLTAIVPDGTTTTITTDEIDKAHEFISKHDGKQNLYYSLNPTRKKMRSKAAKTDIAAVEHLHADLDPEDNETPEVAKSRYRAALDGYPLPPTFINDSGNGIQALWQLAEPIELAEPVSEIDPKTKKKILGYDEATQAVIDDIENRIKALTLSLGGHAGTQNIDRILRIPGTINLPNKAKLERGRGECRTKMLKFNDDSHHTLESFPLPVDDHQEDEPAPADSPQQSTRSGSSGSIDWTKVEEHAGWLKSVADLPADFRVKGRMIVAHSGNLKDLVSDLIEAGLLAKGWSSWSDVSLALAAIFKSDERFTIEQIAAALLCELDCNQHITKIKDATLRRRAVVRALDRSYQPNTTASASGSTDPEIDELNKTFALVIIGDTTAVLKTVDNKISFLRVAAFEQWHANRHVQHGDKKISLGKFWLTHPKRRQYQGLIFSPAGDVPEHYNLWRGFTVEPQPGDCSKFLAHLKDNVCCGNEEHYRWVVGWFAQIAKQPDKKMGTSLAIRGKQGTGKTKIGDVFGSLLGSHYISVSDPRYITGRFNSHLVSCLLLHPDEAFWAGDHAAEGKLKDLVTGVDHLIEFKGKEPIRVHNFVRMLITGNPDWLVPAGLEERRFAVFDMGEDKIQDKEYFAAIDYEMDHGGREALLDHLLKFDLTSVDLRTIPKTAALFDQKLSSLTPEQGWWLDILKRGELPRGCDEVGWCPCHTLFDRYVTKAIRQGVRRRAIETQIGMFLSKYVPGLRKAKSDYQRWNGVQNVDDYGWVYIFTSLKQCREAFAKRLGQAVAWEDEEATWGREPMPDALDF